MFRKVATSFVVSLSLITLAACGGEENASSEASGLSGDPVVMGVILPLSGVSALTGGQGEKAARLAAEQINADGGIDGRPLELEIYDSEFVAEAASREANRAVTRDGVDAIVGGFSSGEALAIREVVERAKIPYIASAAIAVEVTEGATYTYRTAPLITDYANSVVDTAAELGFKEPAVVYDSGPIGLLIADLVPERAEELGLTLSGDMVEFPFQGTDMSAAVAAAARQNPDSVLVGAGAGTDAGLVARTMLEQGLDVPVVSFSPMLSPDARDAAGAAFTELPGVYGLQTLDTEAADTQEWMAAFEDKFDERPTTEHPAQVYDGIMVMAAALSEAGGGDDADAVVQVLNTMAPYDGVSGKEGSEIQFTADNHDGFSGDYIVPYKLNGNGAERVPD
jgi:branched-chain amino acid transport system substrate-binding protein